MSALNIKTKAVVAASFLHLKDAQDNLMHTEGKNPEPVGVNVFGPGSREYQAAQTKMSNRAVQRLQKRGKFEQSADEKKKEQDDDYSFKVEYQGGDIDYFQAQVMSFEKATAGVDSVRSATVQLEITSSKDGVGIVEVPAP